MKRWVAAAAVGVLAVTGCGGGEDGGDAQPTKASLERETRTYIEALLGKNLSAEEAYKNFSKRCQSVKSFSSFSSEFVVVMGFVESVFGKNPRAGEVLITEFDGRKAMIGVQLLAKDGSVLSEADDDLQRYIFEDGAWRDDSSCEG
jgi:hypothetical protein